MKILGRAGRKIKYLGSKQGRWNWGTEVPMSPPPIFGLDRSKTFIHKRPFITSSPLNFFNLLPYLQCEQHTLNCPTRCLKGFFVYQKLARHFKHFTLKHSMRVACLESGNTHPFVKFVLHPLNFCFWHTRHNIQGW